MYERECGFRFTAFEIEPPDILLALDTRKHLERSRFELADHGDRRGDIEIFLARCTHADPNRSHPMRDAARLAARGKDLGEMVGDQVGRVQETQVTAGTLELCRAALSDGAPVGAARVTVSELTHGIAGRSCREAVLRALLRQGEDASTIERLAIGANRLTAGSSSRRNHVRRLPHREPRTR